MGNQLCGILKKKEDADDNDGGTANRENDEKSSKEEVLYATIDHGEGGAPGNIRESGDDSCDYAIITMPSGLAHKPSIQEDCADDYVLMS
ncbi:hypothetical protein MATL_G00175960 [Megalops atlanticus]|uniref:Uncharacterized protein n=1 Tax=Megalops atlanticus TaxID=7932 RepID=A0A9D3T5Z5_MEGAT|nr:hypothetical protein MATL_G00175960 [Megalops atlanticus]